MVLTSRGADPRGDGALLRCGYSFVASLALGRSAGFRCQAPFRYLPITAGSGVQRNHDSKRFRQMILFGAWYVTACHASFCLGTIRACQKKSVRRDRLASAPATLDISICAFGPLCYVALQSLTSYPVNRMFVRRPL